MEQTIIELIITSFNNNIFLILFIILLQKISVNLNYKVFFILQKRSKNYISVKTLTRLSAYNLIICCSFQLKNTF